MVSAVRDGAEYRGDGRDSGGVAMTTSNRCPHLSATGVDLNFGPDKRWRCDGCGAVWYYVEDSDGPITTGDGKGGIRHQRRVFVADGAVQP